MGPMLPSQVTLKWGCVGCAGEEGEWLPGKLGLYKELVIGAWMETFCSSQPLPLALGMLSHCVREAATPMVCTFLFLLSLLNKTSTSLGCCSGASC